MLIGNYGGHMAFATDPLFCLAYPVEYLEKKDPGAMMIRNLENHPVMYMGSNMFVNQLLALDYSKRDYLRTSHGRCLIIPRGA